MESVVGLPSALALVSGMTLTDGPRLSSAPSIQLTPGLLVELVGVRTLESKWMLAMSSESSDLPVLLL